MQRIVVPGVLVAVVLFGCERPAPPMAPPVAEVTVSHPLVEEVADSLEFTGTTAALEAVDIRARVTGFLETVHYQPRAKVKKDQVLFTIDQRPFKNALDSAVGAEEALEAQLVKAQTDLEKVQRLVPQGVASPEELTTKLAIRDSLVGQIDQAKAEIATAKLNLDFCTVTAPTGGRVSRNLVDPGNIVTADVTVLANLVNDEAVYAYFNASEQDVLTLREEWRRKSSAAPAASQPDVATVRPPAFLALMTDTDFPYEGVIDYGAPALDSSTGTMQVRARFPNERGILLPGLFVRIKVPVSAPYKALTVTERALGSDQGQRFLLVVNDKNIVEYRPVKIGTLHASLRVISAGLKPEDWVIVNGMQRVRPGSTVKPIQAPMPTEPAVGRPAPSASAPATAPTTQPAAH